VSLSPFDSYRPPEEPRRGKRRSPVRGAATGAARSVAALRGSSVAPQEPGGRGWLNRDGGGRREAPAVPDAEFSSYYGQPVIKPIPWEWPIPAYLFTGGLAAGSGILGSGAALTGRELLRRRSRIVAVVGTAASGGLLIADLGRPERFLNMMRTVKLTSPMSVGTWILSAYGAASGLTTAAEVARLVPAQGWGPVGGLARVVRSLETPAALGQALVAPPFAAYTAVLLTNTSTPVWFESRRHLPFVFSGSAALASGGVQMVLTPTEQARPARRLAALGAAGELVAMHQLEEHLTREGLEEPLRTGEAGTRLRLAKALTIAGGLGTLLAGRSRVAAVASGAALAAASALTRFGVFEAGMVSAKDPKYTVGPQKRRLEERRSQGQVGDGIVTVG